MALKIEQIAKYNQIYKLHTLLMDNSIKHTLYYTQKGFRIMVDDLPHFSAIESESTTNDGENDFIQYHNFNRTVVNLTAQKALERIKFLLIKEKNNERQRQIAGEIKV